MELKTFFSQDLNGTVIPSATVTVYLPGTTTLASGLQNASGAALTNPFNGDGNGQVVFAAPDGDYDIKVEGAGRTTTMRVRFIDSGTGAVQILRADLASPASGNGAEMVVYSAAQSVGEKLAEISSRADKGDAKKPLIRFKAGGSTSDTVVVNASVNDAADGMSCVTIGGGGSISDENYIGYGKNREVFSTPGTTFSWLHLPTDGDLSNLRLFRLSAFRVMTLLSSPTHYSAVINGSQVDLTLVTTLADGDRLIVEDRAAKVIYSGVRPDYSWIGGGYDNIIEGGVMQHVTGAHHRIVGGDHGTLLGGSYGVINGGSYGTILGGTNGEIGAGGGVGSIVAGGYRGLASGATSTVLGGQECEAAGAQSATVGGYRLKVTGTASVAMGRNNTVSGSDSFAVGDGHSSTANYSVCHGRQHTVAHQYSQAQAGWKASTSWQGQIIDWAYRDGVALNPQRQRFSIDLSLYTNTTSSALMQLLDGSTSITPPASTVWRCTLKVAARGGNLKGATFTVEFAVQRDATTTTLIGTPVVASFVDAGMGTSTNAAAVSVAIASNAIQITAQPRIDTAVATKWAGVLDVVEVN